MSANDRSVGARARATLMVDLIKPANMRGLFALTAPGHRGFPVIKTLSITQPWAWLIAQGHKDIENRRWPTAFRGHFLIHASGKWGHEQAMDLESIRAEFPRLVLPPRFDLGGIVGHAEIVDCVSECDSRWFGGPFGFVIVNASPLPFVPWRGELGFFPAGHELLEACGIIPRTDTEATIRRFA